MRRAILKRSGVAGVSSVILAGVLAVGLAQNASAKGSAQRRGENTRRHLVGPGHGSCRLRVPLPLMSFTALLTFAKGGNDDRDNDQPRVRDWTAQPRSWRVVPEPRGSHA